MICRRRGRRASARAIATGRPALDCDADRVERPPAARPLLPRRGRAALPFVGDQVGGGHAEGVREPFDGIEAGCRVGVLDQAYGLFVEAGAFGQGLLGEAGAVSFLAQPFADVSPEGAQVGGVVVHPPTFAHP